MAPPVLEIVSSNVASGVAGRTSRIQSGPVQAELVPTVNSHGCKCFVDLNHINLSQRYLILLEQLRNGLISFSKMIRSGISLTYQCRTYTH